jgi:hypothetical protein
VATVLWLLVSGFALKDEITLEFRSLRANPCDLSEEERQEKQQALPEGLRLLSEEDCLRFRGETKAKLIKDGAILLGPPIGILVLGLVIGWVARGFRSQ